MVRTAAAVAVLAVVGLVAFRLLTGVAFGIIGLLLAVAWLLLKILIVVGLVYLALSVLAPDAAKKMRDAFKGEG